MAIIKNIKAEEIKDSRDNPTIKVIVETETNTGSFSVPSGASTGIHEAVELRDEDGKGVLQAIEKIEGEIKSSLIGLDVLEQEKIDHIMIDLDGTKNKSRLGGNSIIGVSLACARAAAKDQGIPLYQYLRKFSDIKPSQKVPYLYMNLINGGKHAQGGTSFQEHIIIPKTDNPTEAYETGKKIQSKLLAIIKREKKVDEIVKGDEGGFIVETEDPKESFNLINQAVHESGLDFPVDIGVDIAASSFYQDGNYTMGSEKKSKDDLLEIYDNLIREQRLTSIEDPFQEEDFKSFAEIFKRYPDNLIVGDDLTTTNKILLQRAIDEKSINAIIIKPNQIGTLTETLETMQLARENNIHCIVSHRSGETMDDFVADLAYAFGTYGLKAGAPNKLERDVKYKRLIEIFAN
ncbi:phosphopyruvate hydratase [Candidatus Nomurabacteria bacterium]|nr:phosphopyruvate hydratase [Candidatus Nomurabacteria bacterium]